jgi:hypothetical protein
MQREEMLRKQLCRSWPRAWPLSFIGQKHHKQNQLRQKEDHDSQKLQVGGLKEQKAKGKGNE